MKTSKLLKPQLLLALSSFLSFNIRCGGFAFLPSVTSSNPADTRRRATAESNGEKDLAHRIMYSQHSRNRQAMQYRIISAEACEEMAQRMVETYPDRFTSHKTHWDKFPDGTDNIELEGFSPYNLISGEHVLFLASFHNNDVTLSQFQVSFI